MEGNELTIVDLQDDELDLVVGGNSLVNVNIPIQINVGVQLANQVNVALFSIAKQGGGQNLSLGQFNLNFA